MKDSSILTIVVLIISVLTILNIITTFIYNPTQPHKSLTIEKYVIVQSQNYKAITDILNGYSREGYKLKIVVPGIEGQVIYLVKEIEVYQYADSEK